MLKVDHKFLASMQLNQDFNASACINCGCCTAVCPVGLQILPRRLFRYVLMGAKDRMLENQTAIYSCLLCKMCEENCPSGVHIAENVRSLRDYINRNVYQIDRS